MPHFYESILIDTVDGLQFKSYSNEHPPDHIIAKPKYIPANLIKGEGLKYRFLFENCLVRFNLFAKKEDLNNYLKTFREKLPEYFYYSETHKNWFFAVPKNKIKNVHDSKKGLQELLKVPKEHLDEYLSLVRELVDFLTKSGVSSNSLGITHSTLIGNYTFGKSDIDIIIYGKDNGWKILNYLKTANHEKLKWKTEDEWRKYYQDHKTSESKHFTEDEYVRHIIRKTYEGNFDATVFTLFTVEEPNEVWFKWGEEKYEPISLSTVEGTVTDHYNSHVRPGFYEIAGKFVAGDHKDPKIDKNTPIKRVVNYSIPFTQQAIKGEKIRACGLLELVTPKKGPKYYRVVVGYFDAYLNERREKEFIKVV